MKQSKPVEPLTREKYLSAFSRAVRWRLPPQESEEAISDYRELIFQPERDEAKLVEELGEPIQAAHLLTDVRTYRRWLKVFAVLVAGLFLLAKWAWTGWSSLRLVAFDLYWYPIWVMAVGVPLSLYWFLRHGQKLGAPSKWLLPVLAVMAAFGAGTMALSWYVVSPGFIRSYAMAGEVIPWQIVLLRELLIEGGVACALIALSGLVLAKCCDRRWLALYILALTAAAMFCFFEFYLAGMDISAGSAEIEKIRAWLFLRLAPVALVGLVGTGVALC